MISLEDGLYSLKIAYYSKSRSKIKKNKSLMYDINFFKKSYPLKKSITEGRLSLGEKQNIEKELEKLRSKSPTIFNIETTNYCNMKCVFCARTIYMERKKIFG